MTDISRRIAERRLQLGLSEEMLARQANMSPTYLSQLFDSSFDFDPGAFLRISAALGLTYQDLLEGPSDPPPGRSEPAGHPGLMHLSAHECWNKMGVRGVGRIALPTQPGPVVLPVNYAVDAGTIVYRTAARGPAAARDGITVSFQVDRIDDDASRGWSVLITGTAKRTEDPATVRRLTEQFAVEPWAGGKRSLWIRIMPHTITGRSIVDR
jgi:nitroimidazol reductase NimA-like FMN-containing flavoprotein (pyridoxamine 5'-phosphate oxidase superfamily)